MLAGDMPQDAKLIKHRQKLFRNMHSGVWAALIV